ncbi:MAG: helix-turn-helix domain-containing protein [Clostridia bacterium]|nr:helix-turn-helix domain-containing protein [Clostridia bacterium]
MDKALLEYEMKTRGVSIAELCNALNISRSAFYRKCNGKSEFTRREIETIVNVLHLESPVGIFFSANVS